MFVNNSLNNKSNLLYKQKRDFFMGKININFGTFQFIIKSTHVNDESLGKIQAMSRDNSSNCILRIFQYLNNLERNQNEALISVRFMPNIKSESFEQLNEKVEISRKRKFIDISTINTDELISDGAKPLKKRKLNESEMESVEDKEICCDFNVDEPNNELLMELCFFQDKEGKTCLMYPGVFEKLIPFLRKFELESLLDLFEN
eukprot:GHVU01125777.1.p1 GENE.GHVU01125777.1~~GHVU01125777.1.p1  ORF type:complete len:203 (-),score=22.47 GHVU01125777.1:1055-1663(-)